LRVRRSLPDTAITIITITTLLNTHTHKTDFGPWQHLRRGRNRAAISF
jgi:hypothetical protein